jgi:hypothetical protein
MKSTLFFALVLVSQSVSESQDSIQPRLLPGFDYWELSFQIERSQAIREALEISPVQLAAVKEMRSNFSKEGGRLSQIYTRLHAEPGDKNRNEIRRSFESDPSLDRAEMLSQLAKMSIGNIQDKHSEIRSRAAVEIDDEVRSSLASILAEGQMNRLLPTAMRAKYNSCFAPFSDSAVITFCDLQEWLVAGQRDIEVAKSVYADKVSRFRRDAGQRLISALPKSAQQRFIDYIGNELTKELSCRSGDQLLEEIPFPPISSVSDLLESPELIKAIGISESQAKILRAAENDFLFAISERPRKGQAPKGFIEGIERELHKSVLNALSSQQALQLQRHYANRSFQKDFNYPFSRQGFMIYLTLDDEQAREVKRLAAFEEHNVQRLVRELDGEVFQAMCQKLSPSQQERMSRAFSGIWEIAIVDPRWWSLTDPQR